MSVNIREIFQNWENWYVQDVNLAAVKATRSNKLYLHSKDKVEYLSSICHTSTYDYPKTYQVYPEIQEKILDLKNHNPNFDPDNDIVTETLEEYNHSQDLMYAKLKG